MKRTLSVVLAVLIMSAAIPVIAEDSHQEQYACKVEARKCMTQMDVVQGKIKKMNEGIEKGATYSESDMKKLQMKIKELNDQLDKMKPTGK